MSPLPTVDLAQSVGANSVGDLNGDSISDDLHIADQPFLPGQKIAPLLLPELMVIVARGHLVARHAVADACNLVVRKPKPQLG